jgi:hypothetical protein
MSVWIWLAKVWVSKKRLSTPRPSTRNGTIWVVQALKGIPIRAASPMPEIKDTVLVLSCELDLLLVFSRITTRDYSPFPQHEERIQF